MYNPYLQDIGQTLRPAKGRGPGILSRLKRLDSDDILILLLLLLLLRDENEDTFWPLAAAGLYLLLSP